LSHNAYYHNHGTEQGQISLPNLDKTCLDHQGTTRDKETRNLAHNKQDACMFFVLIIILTHPEFLYSQKICPKLNNHIGCILWPCKVHPVTKFLIIGLVLSFYLILKCEYLWLNVSLCKPCEVLQIFGLTYLMKEWTISSFLVQTWLM